MACAVVAGGILIGTTFGQDNTSPQYLGSPLNCIYGWLMCLAMMAWFHAKFDCTNRFATYITKSSYVCSSNASAPTADCSRIPP